MERNHAFICIKNTVCDKSHYFADERRNANEETLFQTLDHQEYLLCLLQVASKPISKSCSLRHPHRSRWACKTGLGKLRPCFVCIRDAVLRPSGKAVVQEYLDLLILHHPRGRTISLPPYDKLLCVSKRCSRETTSL